MSGTEPSGSFFFLPAAASSIFLLGFSSTAPSVTLGCTLSVVIRGGVTVSGLRGPLRPLGGVAYVSPPSRPGATLWSIAAGPLVNVALVPVFFGLFAVARETGAFDRSEDLFQFMRAIIFMNLRLLGAGLDQI